MPRKTPTRPRSARGKKARSISRRREAVVAITRRLLDLHIAAVRETVAAALAKGLA